MTRSLFLMTNGDAEPWVQLDQDARFHAVARELPGYGDLVERGQRVQVEPVVVEANADANVDILARQLLDGEDPIALAQRLRVALEQRALAEGVHRIFVGAESALDTEARGWARDHSGDFADAFTDRLNGIVARAQALDDGALGDVRSAEDLGQHADAAHAWADLLVLAHEFSNWLGTAQTFAGESQGSWPLAWLWADYQAAWPGFWTWQGVQYQHTAPTQPWWAGTGFGPAFLLQVVHEHLAIQVRTPRETAALTVRLHSDATARQQAAEAAEQAEQGLTVEPSFEDGIAVYPPGYER